MWQYFLPIALSLWLLLLWHFMHQKKVITCSYIAGGVVGIVISLIFYYLIDLNEYFTFLIYASPLSLYPPFVNPFVFKSIWPSVIHVPFYCLLFSFFSSKLQAKPKK